MAKLSVLMPVYNAGKYVSRAIASVQGQSLTDFELLIIDDGSTDDSKAIVSEAAAADSRIHFLARENRGIVETRNELLKMATCNIVAWMDADDISLPERLLTQFDVLGERNEVVCVGSFAQCIDPEDNYLYIETYPVSHEGIVASQQLGGGTRFPTSMMRRDIALACGGFRGPFRMGEDLDLLIRMGEKGELVNLGQVLYLYRQHLSSTCALMGSDWVLYRDAILQLAQERRTHGTDRLQRGGSLELPVSRNAASWRNIAGTYALWAFHVNRRGEYRLSLRYASLAILNWPFSASGWKTALLSLLQRRVEAP